YSLKHRIDVSYEFCGLTRTPLGVAIDAAVNDGLDCWIARPHADSIRSIKNFSACSALYLNAFTNIAIESDWGGSGCPKSQGGDVSGASHEAISDSRPAPGLIDGSLLRQKLDEANAACGVAAEVDAVRVVRIDVDPPCVGFGLRKREF